MHLDISQVIGTGGVGVGGWIAALLWSALKQWRKESDVRLKLMTAQLEDLKDGRAHRDKEKDYWAASATHREREESQLRGIRDEIRRERTGSHATAG